MDLNELRNRTEEFLQEIRKEYFLQGAGYKDELELNRIYSNYPGLFNIDNLPVIKNSISETKDKDSLRKLKFLLEAFYGELLTNLSKDQSEDYIKREAAGTVKIGNGSEVSYRSSVINMMNEGDREKRRMISDNRDRYKAENLNPLLETIFTERQTNINNLGFKNEVDMFQYLSTFDLFKLDNLMQEFLKRTEGLYEKILEEKLKKGLNLRLDQAERHDIAYLNRAKEYDSFFPDGKMMSLASDFLKGMGLDSKANNRITYDIDAREKKSPRAFCCPVKIPEEIFLVIYPRGGEDDYSSFMHELGHAMHYAFVDPGLEMEFKWFGDSSVTEGFAMSFEYLLLNEMWIKSFLGFDSRDYHEYKKHAAMNQLMIVRRYAGKLHYELLLYATNGINGKSELYRDILNNATKIKYTDSDYLMDVDGYFYCANYLRAWIFQAQLRHGLSERFGKRWFERKESGDFFRALWSSGQKYNADEILEMNGFGKLSPDMLIGEIENILLN